MSYVINISFYNQTTCDNGRNTLALMTLTLTFKTLCLLRFLVSSDFYLGYYDRQNTSAGILYQFLL